MNLLAPLLLVLLSPPQAPFEWQVGVPAEQSVHAAIPVQAYLQRKLETEAPAPTLDASLILIPEGGEPVRKPLPKQTNRYPGPQSVPKGGIAWQLSFDLRHAFGRLKPGRYTLKVVDDAFPAGEAKFEVIETTLEVARKAAGDAGAVRLEVKKGEGTLVNGSKKPITLHSYTEKAPLSGLVTVEQWTGRAWTGGIRGFCGTGLVSVVIPAGESRAISLPPPADGIVRYTMSVQAGETAVEVVSEPMLVDTFK